MIGGKKMRVVKLLETGLVIETDMENDISVFQKEIKATILDFATLAQFPDYRIVAIVDDIGASYRNPTCFYADKKGVLYGSVIFCRQYVNDDDFSDIEKEDLQIIFQNKIHDFNDLRGVLW